MIPVYLLKSTLCLTVLYTFHKLALENNVMHHFKRFYLLLVLIFSFVIPGITFTYETEIALDEVTWETNFIQEYSVITQKNSQIPLETDITFIILISIYVLGVLFFGSRYISNLLRLKRKLKTALLINDKRYTLALLPRYVIPHSFLQWLFLSKKEYENQEIALEIVAHEATHVHQKHSWDLLFIEFLLVIFWFNPVLWFIKTSIKVNHEFLADQGVINNKCNIAIYQNILLSYINTTHHSRLESPFNYSLTKKRILMLSKSFNRKKLIYRTLLLIPIIGLCLLFFNNDIVAQTIENPIKSKISQESKKIEELKMQHQDSSYATQFIEGAKRNGKKAIVIEVKNDLITVNNKPSSLKTFISDVNTVTKDWIKEDYKEPMRSYLFKDNSAIFIKILEEEYGRTKIAIASGNSELFPTLPPSPFNEQSTKFKKGDTIPITITATGQKVLAVATSNKENPGAGSRELEIYNELAKKYSTQAITIQNIPVADLKTLQIIYNDMNQEQKLRNEPFPKGKAKN